MAGCTKADRQRKSSGNVRYKLENRASVNKAKKAKKAVLKNTPKAGVVRGAKRAALRKEWMKAGGASVVSWVNFRKSIKE